MIRKSVWVIASLVVVFGVFFLARDAVVGLILEKHTLRTCGKLLGGSCYFEGREREGSSLTLKNVEIHKDGQSALADTISVAWEYGWTTPFVTFDVKVDHLKGDAGMLPLYGVWKAVKHASARKGFRLRSWTFDDIALKTPDGFVRFPLATLEGRGGRVQAEGSCSLPGKGELDITGSHDGSWLVSMRSASLTEVINLLQCWSGQTSKTIGHLEGLVSADLQYSSAGLKGTANIHALTYGSPELALSNLTVAVHADKSLKEWQLEGQLGMPPLHFTAQISKGGQRLLSGKISGHGVPLKELLAIGGFKPLAGEWEGEVDIDGEFDEKGIFASFVPKYLRWDIANTPIALYPVSTSGKLWINFSKGLERLWLNMREAKLRWGEIAEARIQGDLEVGKTSVVAHNIKACCGDIIIEGGLLANNLPDGNTIVIAEGDKSKAGSWTIQRFQARLDPQLNLIDCAIEGKADAGAAMRDLRKLGIDWKEPFDLPGKIKLEAAYAGDFNIGLKGKWETDLLAAEGSVQGRFEEDGRVDLNTMDVSLFIPKVGKMAKYALAEGNGGSYIDFHDRTVDLHGRLSSNGGFGKNLYPKSFKVSGPWNKLAFEKFED